MARRAAERGGVAAEDRVIPHNPCRIRGGGDEKPAEQPVLTIAQVFDLADQLAARRYRALILLTTFASRRWGEAIAMRRCELDLMACTVRIRRQYVEANGSLVIAPPKSRAGVRTVAFPATLVPELRHHLDAYVGPDNAALVFTGQRGGVLRRGNFRRDSGWADAAAAVGMPGLHFHDLRHTGNTLAAQAGVSLADLKARMGHDSVRAAMIYQHAAAEADQKIASTLDQRIGSTRNEPRADVRNRG
jgi:integrase